MMNTDTSRFEPVKTNIAPWLSVGRVAEAMDFYNAAFGAVERYRLVDDEGEVIVAQLAIEEADFWLQEDTDSSLQSQDRSFIRMILTVSDPDAVYEQAIAAGATAVFAVSEEHGWRMGRVVDPSGYHWEIGKPLH